MEMTSLDYFPDTEQAESQGIIEEDCPGHEYEYLEPLPSEGEPDVYHELWQCLVCGRTRVLTAHVGVRD